MQIKYNVTGSQRKALVAAMRTILNDIPHYEGAPTFNYTLGAYTIDKKGTVCCPDDQDETEVQNLIIELEHDGFIGEAIPAFEDMRMTQEEELGLGRQPQENWQGENGMQPDDVPEPDETYLCISMPASLFSETALANLDRLIEAKGGLIKKALGVSDLPILREDDKVCFPWFTGELTPDEIKAYDHFICALCEMARNQKRVTAREKETDNDKYAFRCFLLRLGFIGEEYKAARKILLRNLSGNGAFKTAKGDSENE